MRQKKNCIEDKAEDFDEYEIYIFIVVILEHVCPSISV